MKKKQKINQMVALIMAVLLIAGAIFGVIMSLMY